MGRAFACVLAGAIALAGCDDDSTAGGDGSDAGAPVGMDSGTTTTPPGGEDAGGDDFACPGAMPPPIDPDLLPDCDLCEGAKCVPTSFVPEDQRALLADCGEDGLCVPIDLVETGGEVLLATCSSVGGAEGRCVSLCLPDAAAQADLLPDEGCRSGEVCVPCYDPTTGEDTGACTQGCDPGPSDPPPTIESCCGGLGACLGADVVPADQADLLGPDTCSMDGTLCVPSDLADPTFTPPTCRSVADAEGRCVPACLPSVADQADLLPRADCAEGHLCAPCFDPTTGEDTGACTLNGDMPSEPPVTFDRCCGDLGACVPTDAVPADQRDQLGPDTCEGEGLLCALDTLVAGATPDTCRSLADAEGRCLPACLPDVAAQADLLPRATCPAAHLCVPCFDPTTGENTGACGLNGDMPTEPPVEFDMCCSGLGLCVPSSSVPADQRDLLGTDTCTDAGALCAPTDLIDPTFTPPTCRSLGDAEGRCMPACLPDVAAQADRLPRSTCDPDYLCAPCFDPIDGSSTGSCDLNGDSPAEPPVVFAGCCENDRGVARSRCVPESLVPAGDRDALPEDSCSSGELCVPDPLLDDITYSFPSCTTGGLLFGGDPGACVPDCMVGGFEGIFLRRTTCAEGELCAPCTDPLSGSPSGACR